MFILASQSPQRREILDRLGVSFKVISPPFDESSVHEKNPIKRASLLAEGKAASVAKDYPDEWVIGVDTLVVAENGELLEKPVDEADARRMLLLHSGKTSLVHSALCLLMRCHDESSGEPPHMCHSERSCRSQDNPSAPLGMTNIRHGERSRTMKLCAQDKFHRTIIPENVLSLGSARDDRQDDKTYVMVSTSMRFHHDVMVSPSAPLSTGSAEP